MNHGNAYNEKDMLQDRYPYLICPECLSQNTEVVRRLGGLIDDFHTGDHSVRRKGIWVYDVVRANYHCNDCKCEYYQWLATDRHFLFSNIEIDEDARNVMIYIIVLLAFIVMWVFSWCVCSNNPDPAWWVLLMGIISPIVSGVMVIGGLAEL
jgi:hypothetical protein